jgi:hypothetical protein
MFDRFSIKLGGWLTLLTTLTTWIFGYILSGIILPMYLVDLLSDIVAWFKVGLLLLFRLGIVGDQILLHVLILVLSFLPIRFLGCTSGHNFSVSYTTAWCEITGTTEASWSLSTYRLLSLESLPSNLSSWSWRSITNLRSFLNIFRIFSRDNICVRIYCLSRKRTRKLINDGGGSLFCILIQLGIYLDGCSTTCEE